MQNLTEMTNKTNDPAIERVMQVYGLNINIPINDMTNFIVESLVGNTGVKPVVCDDKLCIPCIHSNDALNIILGCFNYCHEIEGDTTVLTSILSVMNTFRNMRTISFTFSYDESLMDEYRKVVDTEYKGDKKESFNKIYDVTEMEIHLSDSLDRKIVDFLNRMFIFYGYIPNDYMKRRFYIEFEYDEYVNFMEMVFSNNKELAPQLGQNVVNFLILFPVIVMESKPKIRLVTNYYDL